ncbi:MULTISPECIES: hypothetical protein [Halobacterium]|uniref:Uncharacterized protein n=4 Tax=Halobacterium salinarum TaxID=2242 RepID=Q9HR17_HALSA|nr:MULTISPECIES: hypothetical protein [Halobacterium]AAG19341.1 hypothetical protein VNG_0907H [Halobacterium salinarum NRC-1]MBB6090456.1 hypothetical protein [Halobacterium salinarum]MCF2166438.1 hypothetical protein [Halobacterium salinarum]MCF2168397.1 hypothetical protein [Halobacterium salinarum]MCF2206710.1 hypothetical protein [Halobacterium salinarum]
MAVGTLDWIGLFAPFVAYLVALVVYYVWEGRRERRLRERYGLTGDHSE